jgi:hypothetical protein
MDNNLKRILAECLAEMERGAGVRDCLRQHPTHAQELLPYLETWEAMGVGSLADPPGDAFGRGRQAMLAAVAATPSGFSFTSMARAWATVAVAVLGVVVLVGGAAGASAALGGPDVTDSTFDGVSSVFIDGDDGNAADADDGDGGNVVSGQASGDCEDENKGHGNDADHDDEDNPGQGGGNHGAENADAVECSEPVETSAAVETPEACADANRGHGNDPDGFDEDNPGNSEGTSGSGEPCVEGTPAPADGDANRGHGNDPDQDDEDNPGQGQGNHGTGNNGNGDGNANGNGNGNGQQGQGAEKTKD